MDMSNMNMPTTTAAAAAATSTAMSMSMGGSSSCKISMLWNWYTVDTCFIASSWHVTSKGMFAGCCIGVIVLVIVLELLRRLQREFDHYIRRVNGAVAASYSRTEGVNGSDTGSNKNLKAVVPTLASRGSDGAGRLKLWQQLVRSFLFTLQFAVGYFVMLLAMYYNGYFIICIFIGAFLGASIFQWDTYYAGNSDGPETRDSCCN